VKAIIIIIIIIIIEIPVWLTRKFHCLVNNKQQEVWRELCRIVRGISVVANEVRHEVL
jgi:hypothetical protein